MNIRALLFCFVIAGTATGHAAGEADGPASPTSDVGARVIKIAGNDAMRYDVSEITVAPGELIRVELKNVGRMPRKTMSHNWVLVEPMPQADVGRLAMDAASKPPEYLPADQSAIIAHTRMLGPGESDAIEFKAPAQPGKYPYFCTFPGHYTLMKGTLIVK